MSYRLSAKAGQDVEAIYEEGSGRFGRRTAQLFIDRLFDTFERLVLFPKIGALRAPQLGETRTFTVFPYVVLYEVEGAEIVVLRIRHGREDWLNEEASSI